MVYTSFSRIRSSTFALDQPDGALSHNIIPTYCNGIKRVAMRELFSRVAFQSLKKVLGLFSKQIDFESFLIVL